jgi:hypothetical protein
MCLQYKHSIKERKEVTDQIGRKGLSVYKVVAESIETKECLPPYSIFKPQNRRIKKQPYKEGLNEVSDDGYWICNFPIPTVNKKHLYRPGFHFYKQPAAAQDTADYLSKYFKFEYKFKVITCIVKKSWITMIGREWGIRDKVYEWGNKDLTEVIIVAKKAIFPKMNNN